MRRNQLFALLGILIVAAASLAGVLIAGDTPQLGLDLQGGASVVLAPTNKASRPQLQQAVNIIRQRVDGLGVSESSVTVQGGNIVVELPGVKDTQRALDLVGETAELRFRPVLQTGQPPPGMTVPGKKVVSATTTTTAPGTTTTTAPGATTTTAAGGTTTTGTGTTTTTSATTTTTAPAATTTAPGTTAPGATSTTVAGATTTTLPGETTTTSTTVPVPEGVSAIDPATQCTRQTAPETTTTTTAPGAPEDPNAILTARDQDVPDATIVVPLVDAGTDKVTSVLALGPAQGCGGIVKTANAQVDPQTGTWSVQIEFTGDGSKIWDAIAQSNVQKQVAIVLDGIAVSAPVIQTTEFNGHAQITGSFTQRKAKDLALVLRYGSLPVQLEQQSVQNVSATLGKDSLKAGIVAGIIGLALVLIYMVLYYRALGLVVLMGLGVSGALMYSIVSWLGATSGLALSLSGATGIIVSVGVTVDSYVVYFERLKDEIRSGKSVRSSVDRGFAKAFRTILAADLVSGMAAGVLYWLTVGPVRGFAFFLGLSTILDLAVAWFFTRPMVTLLGRSRFFTEARFFGVARGLAAAGGAP